MVCTFGSDAQFQIAPPPQLRMQLRVGRPTLAVHGAIFDIASVPIDVDIQGHYRVQASRLERTQHEGLMLAVWYLSVTFLLATALNTKPRWLRAVGTLTAGVCLAMIALSIFLANIDGTFAAITADASLIKQLTPVILNVQAAIASGAALFLFWAAWRQARRPVTSGLPAANSPSGYGSVSRTLHWSIAMLMFCLIPIGLFMTVLPIENPERASFVAAHQSLGLTLLALVVLRVIWLLINPPPRAKADTAVWQNRVAGGVHLTLYAMLIAFPLTGYVLSVAASDPLSFYGAVLPRSMSPGETATAVSRLAHNWALPFLFYGAVILHAGAVVKRHFVEGRKADVRRMLR